jgi:DNA-binding NarL/FixJ family response regulator/signal transduction histidine kinase
MRLYLTPAALSYLSQFILALLIAGYFVARLIPRGADRPAHRVLLTGFFACVALLILLLGLEAALPLYQRLYALFPQTTVLALGIVLLLQFAYRFPQPLSHKVALGRRLAFDRCKWEALLVLVLSLLYLGYEGRFAIIRFDQLAQGVVLYRGYLDDYPMVAGLVWAPIVFVRQSLAASARQQAGRPQGSPLRRLLCGIWRPFRDLIRPQGQAAYTARALALVYLLPVAVGLLNVLRTNYGIPQDLLQISRSLGLMVALMAFAVIYLNHLPETTSFMVRLVGISLVTLLTVLSAMGWLTTPAYAAQYRPPLPDQHTLRFTPNAAGGYDVSLAPFQFERDPSAGSGQGLGANLHLIDWREGDAAAGKQHTAAFSFTFPYYGRIYDRLYANDEGTIALGHEPTSYFSYALHYGGATPMLLPLLLDLAPGGAGGDVFARQEADRLIVTWQRVPGFYHPEDVYTFQAALYATGVFEFSYNGLPANLAYLPDDEPAARAWAIGAVPGTSRTSSPAHLPSTSSGQVLRGAGSQAPPSFAGKHVLSAAEGGGGGVGPQHVDFASLAGGGTLSGGPQGIVHDYYLDFRRYLHTLLLPLAYLILGASLFVLVVFPSLFHLSLVRPLNTLLAGVRRVNAGDLGTTMPIQYRDEIGFLTESFNHAMTQQRDLVATLETRVTARTADLAEANALLRQEMDDRQAAQTQVVVQERALAVAEEREHLGRELHDGLGQVLGYINVQSQAVQTLLAEGQTAAAQTNLQQMTQAAQDAHADIRNYILGLRRPATAPGDLRQTLEAYLRQFAESHGIQATLSYPADPPCAPFAPAVEEQVLRIVQEALTNIRKHAAATRVEVLFSFTGEQAQIIISDDGVGFEIGDWRLPIAGDKPQMPGTAGHAGVNRKSPELRGTLSQIGNHFGLSIMRERAAQVGGRVEVRSAPGHGTRVLLTLPCAAATPEERDETREMRVLLVDDHPLFLEGLRNLLIARGVNVIGLARDGLEAQAQACALRPNLIVMDLEMPRCNGLEAVRAIKAQLPEIKIVMLTMSEDAGNLFEAIKSGAAGYLLKNLDAGEFVKLLAGVMRGEAPLPPALAARLVAELAATRPGGLLPSAVDHPPVRSAAQPSRVPLTQGAENASAELTPRQWEILQQVARGMTYKEIAATLHLSEQGVKYHMGQILDRLHLADREQAIAYLRRISDKATR